MVRINEIVWNDVKAVELTTDTLKLIAVTQFGPRIAFFGFKNGRNLLFWNTGALKEGVWHLHGGHRTWPTRPHADETGENYIPDNEACEVFIREKSVKIVSAIFTNTGTRRGIEISAVNDSLLQVDNFVENTGDLLHSCGVWSLTCTLPGKETKYVFPVGESNSWNAFSMVMFKSWGGHNGILEDDQINYHHDLMTVSPRGRENKRMFQSHCGIGAMIDPVENFTFAKKIDDYNSAANYPMNCNWAFYIGPENYMVEMETMGPEKMIKPGEMQHSTEQWLLLPEAIEQSKVRGLFDKTKKP